MWEIAKDALFGMQKVFNDLVFNDFNAFKKKKTPPTIPLFEQLFNLNHRETCRRKAWKQAHR